MDDILKQVERKTGVKSADIKQLAQSVNTTDLSNEQNIRHLIKQVARVANKQVPKDTEDKIVQTLTKKNGKVDSSTISKML